MLRPAWENPKLFFIAATGPGFDLQRAIDEREYLLEWIHNITKNKQITLKGHETLAEWQ